MADKPMTEGQRAYEAKRAARAGVSLERWLADKEKQVRAEERASKAAAPKPARPPGFIKRMIDRAHKPL